MMGDQIADQAIEIFFGAVSAETLGKVTVSRPFSMEALMSSSCMSQAVGTGNERNDQSILRTLTP